jgi:hypothetical protein
VPKAKADSIRWITILDLTKNLANKAWREARHGLLHAAKDLEREKTT